MAETDRLEKEASDKFLKEKDENVLSCKNIYVNICDRFSSLETKLKVQMSELTDAQVLEKKNELKFYEKEFHEILDKILKLSQSNPCRFEETKDLLEGVTRRKQNLQITLDGLRDQVSREILCRDISDEKVKNASLLGIKLPKFEGYKSELDFYSFKTKFAKLVCPKVKSCLLPDYLKNNYLAGQALQIVKEIDDLEMIWRRLEECFGHVPTLLNLKLEEIEKCTPLTKLKGEGKINESLVRIRNLMKELSTLATEHGIEHSLYHSSNLAKIFHLLGKPRQTEITKTLLDFNASEEDTWRHVLDSLDKEIRINEKILLFEQGNPGHDIEKSKSRYHVSDVEHLTCHICGKTDHIPTVTRFGKKLINYHSCEKFARMNPKERFEVLRSKKLCAQCLTPGRKFGHEGRCFDKYACPDESHRGFNRSLHILVCDKHKNNEENLRLLDLYKSKCVENRNQADFSKDIRIAFHVDDPGLYEVRNDTDDCAEDVAIYMLQTIKVGGQKFNLFYDNGCSDMVVSKKAADLLTKVGKARNISKKTVSLTGIGDLKTVGSHGRFQITLPLHNGREVRLSGACLDKITSCFPTYPLDKVGEELRQVYSQTGRNSGALPRLPKSVGGDTDIMIGIQYLKYWPKFVYQVSNGLTLYESQFKSHDSTRGVVGGPHESFNDLYEVANANHVYYSDEVKQFVQDFRQGLDTGIRDVTECEIEFTGMSPGMNAIIVRGEGDIEQGFHDEFQPDESKHNSEQLSCYPAKKIPKRLKMFEMIENAGTDISYRCINCRSCSNCKKSAQVEYISLQEELEQGMIDKSVSVNPVECYSEAYLPSLCDPLRKLASNYNIAEKSYYAQAKKLSSRPENRKDVLNSMEKLRNLGYVSKFDDLTDEQKSVINSSPVKYYIPWLIVWNANSISTPCRSVFNASSVTASGYSLNCLLPKGRNNLNKLVQIFILWLTYFCAFCTDVQKMYNTIRLVEDHWCYQLFLWDDQLSTERKPVTNVIKTLIYGVRTSGNQAERALRETTKLFSEEYPRQDDIIQNQTYVDDCASGTTVFNDEGYPCKESSYDEARQVTDDLQTVLSKGNFNLKGVVFSGHDPPEHLCNEDKSVTIFGIRWFPKSDTFSLNIGEPNFSKNKSKNRSKNNSGVLTRRQCAGRSGEIFDLNGRFAPLVTELKLDLHDLCIRKLDWDDDIPDDLISKWLKNLDTITAMKEIKFRRCVVPEDGINLDIETIEICAGSSRMFARLFMFASKEEAVFPLVK